MADTVVHRFYVDGWHRFRPIADIVSHIYAVNNEYEMWYNVQEKEHTVRLLVILMAKFDL